MEIVEALRELGVEYREAGTHHHVTQGWCGVDCPWCSPHSGRFRLGINLSGLFCSCWTCGSHRLADVLVELGNTNYAKVRALLGSLLPKRTFEEAPRGRLQIPNGVGDLEDAHSRYLASRRLDPEALTRVWGVRGIGVAPALSWRLWIPIHYRGQVVSWTTRTINPDPNNGRRYISARPDQEAISHRKLLYGHDLARHAAIVVEGPTDAWRVGPGAVATLGVAFSRAQVEKLSQFSVRAICFDSEPEAQKRARKLASLLEPFPGETYVVQLSADDPGSASDREIAALRREFLGD